MMNDVNCTTSITGIKDTKSTAQADSAGVTPMSPRMTQWVAPARMPIRNTNPKLGGVRITNISAQTTSKTSNHTGRGFGLSEPHPTPVWASAAIHHASRCNPRGKPRTVIGVIFTVLTFVDYQQV
jgi:hypothetical protein